MSPPSQARVICTLGMHRSGTSVVARMLNLLGVQLGPDERVLTSGEDNPKGYWEHRSFVDLNDEILARFGARWEEAHVLPPKWPQDPRLADLREKARELLTKDFSAEPLWGWKDPRTCLTLPFWQDLIGPMRYVMCLRNPCAVVASLHRRSGMRSEDAERLWLSHVHASLAHTSGLPRLFVFYEDIMDDWRRELRRLAEFVGNPERAEDPAVHEATAAFHESEMCHHRMSMEDLARDPQISFPTTTLYLALRGHATTSGRSVQMALDLLSARAVETWDWMAGLTTERESLARANQAQAAQIAGLRAERDALELREQQLALREERLLESIASLGSALRARTAERDAQVRQGGAAVWELEQVYQSSSWRLVTLARAAVSSLLPPGTRRRRVFDNLLRRITRRLPKARRPRPADLRAA